MDTVNAGPNPASGATKRCGKCRQRKSLEDFHSRNLYGFQSYCKKCNLEYNKSYHIKTQRKRKRNRLHGLTDSEFHEILIYQSGRCAICIEPLIDLNIDHDHSCCPGAYSCGDCVRGFICTRCNILIGYIETSKEILEAVFKYLERG